MDDLDFAILREMLRGGAIDMEGVQPWRTPDAIARAVGASRSTVQARQLAWRKRGFLRGYSVSPNPVLLGLISFGQTVRVDDPRQRAALFDRLAKLDGLAIAVESVGPWIVVVHADTTATIIRKRAKEIESWPGVAGGEALLPSRLPPATIEPTAQDWRIIRQMRREPEANMKKLAASLGLSAKTIQRRLTRLLDGNAVHVQPNLDFAHAEGAFADLILVLEDPRQRDATVATLRQDHPRLLERNRASGPDAPVAQVTIHFGAAAQAEDAVRRAAALPGVAEVELIFPIRVHQYPKWIDAKIEEKLRESERDRAPARTERNAVSTRVRR